MNEGALPHGGVLINRVLNKAKIKEAVLKEIPRITVEDDFILDAEKIAIGAYSPLKGFMCREDVAEVVYNLRLASKEVWTIPITLSVDSHTARKLRKGQKVILCNKKADDIAILQVKEVFSFPKNIWAKKVFNTDSRKHPGVNRLYQMPDLFVGGDIWLIQRPSFRFQRYNLDPAQTRRMIRERGWRTIAGFQTRNVPHRAHEYLQKTALSLTDGLLIHPIIGWKKDGDFQPGLVIEAYKILMENYFPKNRVIFAGLATAMRYAGPREAIFHAVIRKNYGCTHFIVGRDHAGVEDFYKLYDAHKIFERFPDLGITPLLLRGPYYCMKCSEVVSDKICPHKERWHKHISGTIIRGMIMNKKSIPSYLMRPEVVEVILDFKKKTKGRGWHL